MKISIFLPITLVFLTAISFADYNHTFNPPAPAFQQESFLRIHEIPEMTLDFAISWTDSAAGFFLKPYDAAILHVRIDGNIHDVFIFSDAGMQRLCIWMCTPPDNNGDRTPEVVTAYYGEDCGYLSAPSGITTSVRNREFDPENDLIYLADRGHDRVLELTYSPNLDGGKFYFNRSIGANYLEWPVDVAISTYGSTDPLDMDLYVVDWGHGKDQGKLSRFDLNGNYLGSWPGIPAPAIGKPVLPYARPVSVECYPDTQSGYELIYISESKDSRIFCVKASKNTQPKSKMFQDLKVTSHFWLSGGIACDDYGRTYICNTSESTIESWEPSIGYPYPIFTGLVDNSENLSYPCSIILDTYYGVCEALVLEYYTRNSGIKTFIIDGGSSLSKPRLGFAGGYLIAPKVNSSQLPLVYSLKNAYPNPFNSQCIISFTLPERAEVALDVYNILGQRVRRLMNEEKAAGAYSIGFNAENLSSGVYFYKLTAGTYSSTKAVVLIK